MGEFCPLNAEKALPFGFQFSTIKWSSTFYKARSWSKSSLRPHVAEYANSAHTPEQTVTERSPHFYKARPWNTMSLGNCAIAVAYSSEA